MTELLAPAGSLKSFRFACAYGADAIYAGQPRYSLRVRNNEFNYENLKVAREESRRLGKKLYIAVNIAPHNSKIKTFLKDMEPVIALEPDALIMSDPGLIMMVQRTWPAQVIHLSVQANVTNYAAVEFWHNQGIRRIILSRELSLDEIFAIREACPDMELETFVHGALCIAYSGRCLLSGYFNHRDPNQGSCTNACRWKYDMHEATENSADEIIPTTPVSAKPTETESAQSIVQQVSPETAKELIANQPEQQQYVLQEKHRPGEYMPIFQDEHGTYIMNSKDLRAIQHVDALVKKGIHSVKIEGRTKSHYYVARTTQAYRRAIDDALANRPFNKSLMDELENLSNRGYTEGFYRRHVHDEYQQYDRGYSQSEKQQFVGEVIDGHEELVTIAVKNRFSIGDELEVVRPKGNFRFTLTNMENRKGQKIDTAPGSGHVVRLAIPGGAQQLDDFSLICKNHQ